MTAPIDIATNRKIRALLKEGFTYTAIAKECGVSAPSVHKQAVLLEALGKFKLMGRGAGGSRAARENHGTASHRLAQLTMGHDGDESGVDLCDLFATPRTPRQIRYFSGGG